MNNTARIHMVDALRGFALLGILYVHAILYFLANSLNEEVYSTAIQTSLDPLLRSSVYWFGLSKFYSIFSMLFGLSFYIQLRNGQSKDSSFHLRFIWKLVLLAGFAIIHRVIFFGDILVVYAAVGLLLVPVSSFNNRVLFGMAILLMAGLGRMLYFALFGTGQIFEINYMLMYQGYMKAVLNGSFLDVASANLGAYPQFWNEHFGFWGRFYNTFGYFILGLLIGRLGILENLEKNLQLIKRLLIVALICSVVGLGLHLKFIGFAWDIFKLPHDSWHALAWYGIYDFFAIAMTFVYATGFILLVHKFQNSFYFRCLSAYGRTGLTSYITQSVLGTFIFFNWGLGLIHETSFTMNLLVFAFIAFVQITFSYQWLRRFKYGPLEWLWRSLTYLKWMPNRISR